MAARRQRRIATALAAATATLTVGLATGCSTVDRALDCMQTAHSIAENVTDLQFAAAHAAVNPDRTDASLKSIDKNLKEMEDTGEKAGDTDVTKAVHELTKAVDNVRTSIKNGDKTPDLTPLTDAADDLTKACTTRH
ncbi:hypothetical protein ABT124_42210 [Streptomyces sp. NPDC001982]|uniref:hypothetical protein n=1 Tax=unclassified Streptomyces TaxID=2593676 RepID=UPI003330B9E0